MVKIMYTKKLTPLTNLEMKTLKMIEIETEKENKN
jgi:hypothetical protein